MRSSVQTKKLHLFGGRSQWIHLVYSGRAWHEQLKELLPGMHGHQKKTLALFVLGIVLSGSAAHSLTLFSKRKNQKTSVGYAGQAGSGRRYPACLNLPGPLTRLASDHTEQRQWTAPASSYVRAPTAESLVAVSPATGRICLLCQLAEECKELLRLTDEQPVGREGLDCAHCSSTPRISVGRMIETAGNLRLRKTVGSGMIRLVWMSSPPNGGALRSGNTNPLVGSVRAGALPALSCQV